MSHRRWLSSLLFSCALIATTSCATQFNQRRDVQQFIHGMVVKHHFNEAWLENTFAQVQPNKQVLKLISKPAEKKPWYFYRTIFITNKRIQEGVTFWRQNASTLQRAEQIYGVPASVIVSIIGVETSYGNSKGNIRILDALSTLAFEYPPREKFFRNELEQFLILSREQSWNPTTLYGSYAGAMGYPQFMPSNYRKYAVGFDSDPKIDLVNSSADAIGSIGNYLKMKGWRPAQPIASQAHVKGTAFEALGDKSAPQSLATLEQYGVYPDYPYPLDTRAGFLKLTGQNSPEYWLLFRNFYVIMTYNNSTLYAMSVYQLSQLLEQAYRK